MFVELILSLKPGKYQLAVTGIILVLISSCITQFIPETTGDQDLLVVEGLITDQPGQNVIRLSTSMPLGVRSTAKPLGGCNVSVSDDQGNSFNLRETTAGTYVADPGFSGIIGRSYTLHVLTNSARNSLSYQSSPVLLKPVPPIDSIYYEKVVLSQLPDGWPTGEGCKIYLNTHDPENNCRFYRWEYVETWEFILPYNVRNQKCWISNNSGDINIKSTSSLSEDRIIKLPLNFITNTTDRLRIAYSILVKQYSLNEDEYVYWEKLKNVVEQVGSLYDIIPASIPSNIKCNENPDENVLGFFSVSSVKSKRSFISESFRGIVDLYTDCENKVVGPNTPIPDLNVSVWVIIDHKMPPPAYKVLTYKRGCADCTFRGSNIKPDFWPYK